MNMHHRTEVKTRPPHFTHVPGTAKKNGSGGVTQHHGVSLGDSPRTESLVELPPAGGPWCQADPTWLVSANERGHRS